MRTSALLDRPTVTVPFSGSGKVENTSSEATSSSKRLRFWLSPSPVRETVDSSPVAEAMTRNCWPRPGSASTT